MKVTILFFLLYNLDIYLIEKKRELLKKHIQKNFTKIPTKLVVLRSPLE